MRRAPPARAAQPGGLPAMIDLFRKKLRNLPRPAKRALLISTDILLLLLVLWVSYSLRLGEAFDPTFEQFAIMACAPVVAIPIFARLGLYRAVIRYLPERAIWVTVRAMSLATLVWIAVLFLTSMSGAQGAPRSIPLFYWVFGIWAVAGVRFGAKALLWPRAGRGSAIRRQVLVYGTDEAALQLAAAINQQADRLLAGFLETDRSLFGRDIMGVRVYPEAMVAELIRNFGIREILVSLPSVDPDRRKKLLSDLREHPVKIRALPALSEMTSGRALEAQLRNMEIDDLLGRSAVPPRSDLLLSILEGKVVCVSGAAGSIGSELARLVVRWSPRKLILLDISEFGLYQIERTLANSDDVEIVTVLGSVADEKLVNDVFRRHGVQIVFHTAAYKHVPLVEANPIEGARNNVLGTDCFAAGRPRMRRRTLRPDLDRQGRASVQRDGGQQAVGGAHHPVLRRRGRPQGQGRRSSASSASATFSGRAARSCRCSGSRSRPAARNPHPRRHDALLHVDPRGRRTHRTGGCDVGGRRHLPSRHGRADSRQEAGGEHDPPCRARREDPGAAGRRHRNPGHRHAARRKAGGGAVLRSLDRAADRASEDPARRGGWQASGT